jgi:tetratricopeptide (TPR) repeat protein
VRTLLVLAGPVVFFSLLEGGLFLGGFGYPTSFYIPSGQPGLVTTNARFGWHYQRETFTAPEPCLLAVDKPKDTIRIFVLGESAAQGTPDPSFGFARILEVMLRSSFPDERFEVVNAAMRGINSHVLVPIAKECAGLSPDLFLVYMGNNELNGLYGPKTAVSWLGRHPRWIPAYHHLRQTRTAQLLCRVLGANPEAREKRRKLPTLEDMRKYRTALDDPQRSYVYANFGRNLEQICKYALQAGAGVIVSTVAVNLRDCPPLGSLHRADLAGPQLEEWERLYRAAIMAETGGDTAQALAGYEQALALDDHYAELHFRLARCRLATGDRAGAKRHFTLARDWDALPFRADTKLNDLIRETAGRPDGGFRTANGELKNTPASDQQVDRSTALPVKLVEMDAALATGVHCPDGIPGQEFFYEHVHLRFDGDYEVAQALLPAVVQSLQGRGLKLQAGSPNPESDGIPSRAQCAQALAFTAWDEVNTAAAMVKMTAQPPFTGQLDHTERQAAAERSVAVVTDHIDEAFVQRVLQSYHQAITAQPQDWHLHYNLGTLLHQLERYRQAAAEFEVVVRTLPHVAPFRIMLGYALGRTGLLDQAAEQFRQALKYDSHSKEAREGLQWARQMKSRAGR